MKRAGHGHGVAVLTILLLCARLLQAQTPATQPATARVTITQAGVRLKTSDAFLQRLYDEAERKATGNITASGPYKLMVEGGGFDAVWIETQPMAGAMYAKRNLAVALGNQLVFLRSQRADGRLPGMITLGGGALKPEYAWLQGYYFPTPALKVYYYLGKDRKFLEELARVLEAHDAWLWRERDSNGDGCLETWCIWDTGEDASTRLNAPDSWGGNKPPAGYAVPYQSMDVMGYSHEGRSVLARIAKELHTGREEEWNKKAAEVRQRVAGYLWRPDKHACYDRDKDGKFLDVLIHNNIRAMWYGLFSQQMADEFIHFHLLNPAEFWTPIPLPSIAVNDPLFRNNPGNNWSGQPEGLTYQRAIRALENYGHYAELGLLADKLFKAVGTKCQFSQQFDPFSGQLCPPGQDNYGPTMIAVLEYISKLYGVDLDEETLVWSGLQRAEQTMEYTWQWSGNTYAIQNDKGVFRGSINGVENFSCDTGVRLVTDLQGNVRDVIGLDTRVRDVILRTGGKEYKLTVKPNQVWRHSGTGPFELASSAPFEMPAESPPVLIEYLLAGGEQIKTDGKFVQATRFGDKTNDIKAFGVTWAKWPGTPATQYTGTWAGSHHPSGTVDVKGANFGAEASGLLKAVLHVNYNVFSGTFSNLTTGKRYRAQFIVNNNHPSRDLSITLGFRSTGSFSGVSHPQVVTFEWTASRDSEKWTCSGREGLIVGFAIFELNR